LGERFDRAEFSDSDIEFVDALAALAAISISNASLIDRLKTANRKLDRKIYELNTLFELSKQFNEMDEKEQIADILKFTLMGHLFVRKLFFAYRLSADDRSPACISANNLSEHPDEDTLNQLFDEHQSSDIIPVSQLKQRPAFVEEEHIQKLFYLRFQNETLAIIGLGNKANGTAYDPAEEQLILSMSNLALLSIQKVSLLQQKIEKERMEEELNLAKSIQKGLLPETMPVWDKYEIFGMNKSSQQVGGDYFEVREATDGSWVLAIADVTGKGFPASLLMSNLQAALHTLMQSKSDITEATARLNDTIYNNTPSDKFITFFWGKFNPDTGVLTYVNAGHNPPFLYRKEDGSISELQEGGLLLGAMPSMMPYESGEVKLQSGDMIVMFTDGLTEVFDAQEEEFGEERLAQVVKKHVHLPAKEFTEHMVDAVMQFSSGVQYDDITSLVLRAK
jgi:sigma-B regulation protein RsbU (phosphoserine phosphatase)